MPLAICVAEVADIDRYAMCAHLPHGLLEDLLPGPVTVLLTRRLDAALSALLNPGVATLGEAYLPGHPGDHVPNYTIDSKPSSVFWKHFAKSERG